MLTKKQLIPQYSSPSAFEGSACPPITFESQLVVVQHSPSCQNLFAVSLRNPVLPAILRPTCLSRQTSYQSEYAEAKVSTAK